MIRLLLDGSDEKNCNERHCFETEFRCSTGRCIPANWVRRNKF